MRPDGRKSNEMRTVKITPHVLDYAEGSVLIELGKTKVICSASIEDKVPLFLKDQSRGWITAEYAMIPRATETRTIRESTMGRISGRTHEIQRLIGRSLRSVVDLDVIAQKTFWIDCDVIQADGGTRTAAITGAFISLCSAIQFALNNNIIEKNPLIDNCAAVSVGIIDGIPVLDLCYEEDASAQVDMNIVMSGNRKIIEIQGTGEENPFSLQELNDMLRLAEEGIQHLTRLQQDCLHGLSGSDTD